jgi:predicted alpha-1,6-mannanase (GH76 family)
MILEPWKKNCTGGLWFDTGYNSKATITNALFVELGFKLYQINGLNDTLTKANNTLNWIRKNGIIRPDGKVSNAVNLTTCKFMDDFRYTYNSGIMANGVL